MNTRFVAIWISMVLSLACFNLSAQLDPPELRCIYVEDNGDITLTWIPVDDPINNGQFLNYQIYTSANGVPFNLVTSLPTRLQNVFTIVGANFPIPGISDVRFYIITEYNDGSTKLSVPSDTLTAMELTLTTTGNTSGNLAWNQPRSTPLPTWDPTYNIGQKLVEVTTPPTVGTWNDNYALPNYGSTTFNDDVTRCLSDISYRIELKDASGCVSRSNTVEARLQDVNGAAPMTFNRITMDGDNNRNVLNWSKHPDGSVTNYIIVYNDANGTAIFIDTVSANTFEYEDPEPNRSAFDTSQCYQIIPLDSCGNSQGAGKKHCTMFLDRSYDPCAGEVTLFWNLYEGWDAIKEQNVYMRVLPDSNFVRLGTINGNETSFIVSDVNALDVYVFYIEAIDGSGLYFSHSNRLGTRFKVNDRTSFLKLRGASVEPDNSIALKVLMDRSALISHINIYRSIDNNGPYKIVGRAQAPANPLDTLFTIYDASARPDQLTYNYFLEVIDTCNMPIIRSNTFRTLFLNGDSDADEMQNYLFWNSNIYVDSSASYKDVYSIYRGINRNYLPEPLWTKSVEELFYEDDIREEIHNGSKFCYRVALFQSPSDTFEIADTSYSNEVCFDMEPDIFIANSFTPNNDGINETWRPVTSYVIPFQNYLLRIYDRWGNEVFETADPLAAWDGKYEGGIYPAGSYIYHLRITSGSGSVITRRGSFSLFR